MSANVPTTIKELVAKVTQSTANIAKHRAAMADVATQIRQSPPSATPAQEGK